MAQGPGPSSGRSSLVSGPHSILPGEVAMPPSGSCSQPLPHRPCLPLLPPPGVQVLPPHCGDTGPLLPLGGKGGGGLGDQPEVNREAKAGGESRGGSGGTTPRGPGRTGSLASEGGAAARERPCELRSWRSRRQGRGAPQELGRPPRGRSQSPARPGPSPAQLPW